MFEEAGRVVLTQLFLVDVGVVVTLDPTVTVGAAEGVFACCLVVGYGLVHVPAGAILGLVFVQVWPTAEVLPIVGVNAQIFIMIAIIFRAPHRFEVKHVEVVVSHKIAY